MNKMMTKTVKCVTLFSVIMAILLALSIVITAVCGVNYADTLKDCNALTVTVNSKAFEDKIDQIEEKCEAAFEAADLDYNLVKYGKMASEFLDEYESGGRVYDYNYLYKEKMSFQQRLLISLGVGLVAALIVLGILFAQLKSVGTERRAKEYVRDGSFHVTRSRDVFLYRNVTRRKIERNHSGSGGSRTHRTSGGRRAGGRTGSF